MTALARRLAVVRRGAPQGRDAPEDDVAVEEPLEIQLHDGSGWRSLAVLMRTPDDDDSVDEELAVGFLCCEGIVSSASSIESIRACTVAPSPQAEGNVLQVKLAAGVVVDWARLVRHTFASSSCGVCGKASIESACARAQPLESTLVVDVDVVLGLVQRLRGLQPVFSRTGGLHGALLGTATGDVLVVREDVGRHNAVDKVIGHLLRRGLDPAGLVLVVSGRVGFELVQKALAARLPLIVGVGAPTSLAVELGREGGVAVAGFAKEHSCNVYAHPKRVKDSARRPEDAALGPEAGAAQGRSAGGRSAHGSSVTTSLEAFCAQKLAVLEARSQRRSPVGTRRGHNARIERVVEGQMRALVDFSSNDSLGLSHHPEVLAAASAALHEGAGSGGSRLVSGSHPSCEAFEARLATLSQQAAALVVGSGWLANIGVVPALVGSNDVVVIDALAHASLMAGARLSGARVVIVAHNDLVGFGRALAGERAGRADGAILVVTESVFSMDGDRAPLPSLVALCRAHDAWLLVDDAHGFLIGDGSTAGADVVTGTLSKASGSYGGTIAGPRALIDLLFTRCRPMLFGSALPPAVIAAAAAAVDVALREPDRRLRPLQHARRFCLAVGLPLPASHIVPLVVGEERATLALMAGLVDDGHLAVAIRPPTVPAGSSRLRLAFSAAHSEDDVDALAAAVIRRWQR